MAKTVVQTLINAPLEKTFDAALTADIGSVFRSFGPIPAIQRVEPGTAWSRVGDERTVYLADGSLLKEKLIALDRPRRFIYQGYGHTNALRFLVSHAFGTWNFDAVGEQTQLRWNYEYVPRSFMTAPLVAAFVHGVFRGYMRNTLKNFKAFVEAKA